MKHSNILFWDLFLFSAGPSEQSEYNGQEHAANDFLSAFKHDLWSCLRVQDQTDHLDDWLKRSDNIRVSFVFP